jgi:hypothetical protein
LVQKKHLHVQLKRASGTSSTRERKSILRLSNGPSPRPLTTNERNDRRKSMELFGRYARVFPGVPHDPDPRNILLDLEAARRSKNANPYSPFLKTQCPTVECLRERHARLLNSPQRARFSASRSARINARCVRQPAAARHRATVSDSCAAHAAAFDGSLRGCVR